MALGVTLGELITNVQLECYTSANPAHGQNFRDNVIAQINRAYEHYFRDHKWPHLRGTLENGFFDKLTAAGERYYDWPEGLDPDTVEAVYYQYGTGVWVPLLKGISLTDYASYDSDNPAATGDPAIKWQRHGPDQFEIWPRAALDGRIIRFCGMRQYTKLSADGDQCLIDNAPIELRAASRLQARKDPKEAARLDADAEAAYRNLRHRQDGDVTANFAEPKSGVTETRPRIIVVNGS